MPANIIHASCVVFDGKAVLIKGASGAGKSTLSLQLMAVGATLLADDRVILSPQDGALQAMCPDSLKGLIEARGIGILHAEFCDKAPISLVIDLDVEEVERIPPRREVTLLGVKLPLLHRVDAIHLPSAIRQFMRGGRSEP